MSTCSTFEMEYRLITIDQSPASITKVQLVQQQNARIYWIAQSIVEERPLKSYLSSRTSSRRQSLQRHPCLSAASGSGPSAGATTGLFARVGSKSPMHIAHDPANPGRRRSPYPHTVCNIFSDAMSGARIWRQSASRGNTCSAQ